MGAPLDGDFVGRRGASITGREVMLASEPGGFNQTYDIPITTKHG